MNSISPARRASMLVEVLNHIDEVLEYPQRKLLYPDQEGERAVFPVEQHLSLMDNLRVSVDLAHSYAEKSLVSHDDEGIEALAAALKGFTVSRDQEAWQISGKNFILRNHPLELEDCK